MSTQPINLSATEHAYLMLRDAHMLLHRIGTAAEGVDPFLHHSCTAWANQIGQALEHLCQDEPTLKETVHEYLRLKSQNP